MKHLVLLALIFCLLALPTAYGQETQQCLTSLIKPSKTLLVDVSEQVAIKNLTAINTEGIEYCPVFYKTGIVFSSDRSIRKNWLGRKLSNHNSNLLFSAIDQQGDLYRPIPLPGKVNSNRHEGSATFNASQNLMVYTRNCKTPSAKGYYELKLASARLENGQWVEHVDLPFNENFRTCHPALSPNGNVLIFASNRPNGLGGMDLYASEFINGEWTTPYNLGQEINTSGDEVFPFLDAEGTLYFSSNGHPGMGGLDILKATQNKDGRWSNVIRFPEPFNSRWDDFSFITDQELVSGFLSSNRPGGMGMDDIYSWKISTPVDLPKELEEEFTTQFSILDEKTGLAFNESEITLIQINPNLLQTGFLEEPITIVNQLNENVLALLGKVIEPLKNPEPYTIYPITANNSYLIIAKRPGLEPFQQIVLADQLLVNAEYALVWPSRLTDDVAIADHEIASPSVSLMVAKDNETNEAVVGGVALLGVETPKRSIPSTNAAPIILTEPTEEIFTSRSIPENLVKATPAPLEAVDIPLENTVIIFNPIYHDFNNHEVISNEEVLIDNIVWEMNQHKDFKLLIKSYSDIRGSEAYNLQLSQKRAETVMNKLITRGISPIRLTAKGMGESNPLIDCSENNTCTEEDHQLNRRTEFEIKRFK